MELKDFDIIKIGKRNFWQWPDGTLRAVVSGGADGSEDDNDDDEGDDDEEDEDDEPKDKKGKKFTQRQVNAVATREKRDGIKAGRRKLLEEMGFATEEELKEAVQAKQDGQKKDDADTAAERKKLDKEKADAKSDREAAAKDKHDAKVERRMLRAGVQLKKLEKVARLIDVEVGAEPDEIDEAIEELKEDFPEFFSSNSDDDDEDDESDSQRKGTESRKKGKNPDSNPGRKAGGAKAKSSEDKAKERLAARHPEFAKN